MTEENEFVKGLNHEGSESLPKTPSSSTQPTPSKRQHDDNDHHLSVVHEIGNLPQNPKKTKRSPQSDWSPSLPTLPHEIIVEIFSRLPVRTLMQFRCVSKSLSTLISDPEFVKNHLRKITYSESKLNPYQRLLFIYSGPSFSLLKSCSLYSIFNNSQTDVIELHNRHRYHYDWLVESCDGLLCVAGKQSAVALWNPSTRVFNKLPDLGFGKKSGSYTVFGYGYDSEIDDYKIVAVFCFPRRGANGAIGYDAEVKVCTRWSNFWRRIEGFRYGVPYDVSGKYINGTLNWPVMCERNSAFTWIIVSFDLAKETYKEIMQPDNAELGYDKTLGVLDGCLCLMCNFSAVHADFWVMKEYGVRESWTKLVSIPYSGDSVSHNLQYSVPYCIADNGEVLLEFERRLVIYNPKDGTFRYPVINGAGDCVDTAIYVESLVSPKVEDLHLSV